MNPALLQLPFVQIALPLLAGMFLAVWSNSKSFEKLVNKRFDEMNRRFDEMRPPFRPGEQVPGSHREVVRPCKLLGKLVIRRDA